LSLPLFAQGYAPAKGKIAIPDLNGYVTMKCDFHIHTVFSDGTVWPTVRVDEAFREGIDAIALTEHLEGQRYLQEFERLTGIPTKNLSRNLSYEAAQAYAKEKGIILIRGGEITRAMPPGHNNAIFIKDADALVTPEYMDAFRAAKAQNAFIFWNHPGWLAQQPDTTLWFDEHTQLLQQGMMHGMEVVNGSYFIEAHRWCLEKKLTMIGNTDAHGPLPLYAPGKHRTMTLVFARNATPEAIYEALKDRRTAVYFDDYIIGEEKYLKELFEKAIEVVSVTTSDNTVTITIKNKSDIPLRLRSAPHDSRIVYLRNFELLPFTLAPQATQTITVRLNNGVRGGNISVCVENFLVEPNKGLIYTAKL
jgi:hypothetical protein